VSHNMFYTPVASDNSGGKSISITDPAGIFFVGNISNVYFDGS